MRRHHNPRYAPEYLERKLNPSDITGVPVAAEVFVPNTQPAQVSPLTVVATSASEPVTPATGTDPAPPVGNGDPPIGGPSTPIGPAVPA
jgi:hypothetical protein